VYVSRNALLSGLCVGLLFAASVDIARAQTDYLYVTDYGAGQADPAVGGNMDRYQFTYNSVSNTISNFTPYGLNGNTSSAVFIAGGIKEGVQGTQNDIIAVAKGGATLVRYNLNGGIIGTIPVTLGGASYSLNGIGNIIISQNGYYLYVPESSTTQNGLTGGAIDKISLATGAIVAQVPFSGAHDLLLENGTIYAAAYSGSNSASSGIWTFDTNLGSKSQMVVSGANGLTRPTGMSFQGTTLYVNQDLAPSSANSVYEYNVGSVGGTSATYINSYSSSNLNFIFGSAIGPDGNVYIAALGGGVSGNDTAGYTDGVYEFNNTNQAVSLSIGGEAGNTDSGPPGASGLYAPKYLQFSTNFVPYPDVGYNVPEPGQVALFCSLGLASAGWWRRKKRQQIPSR
jgi:hypothetical protein